MTAWAMQLPSCGGTWGTGTPESRLQARWLVPVIVLVTRAGQAGSLTSAGQQRKNRGARPGRREGRAPRGKIPFTR